MNVFIGGYTYFAILAIYCMAVDGNKWIITWNISKFMKISGFCIIVEVSEVAVLKSFPLFSLKFLNCENITNQKEVYRVLHFFEFQYVASLPGMLVVNSLRIC